MLRIQTLLPQHCKILISLIKSSAVQQRWLYALIKSSDTDDLRSLSGEKMKQLPSLNPQTSPIGFLSLQKQERKAEF